MNDRYESIRRFMVDKVPFNKVLGLELISLEDGVATMRIPFREELLGDVSRPAIHGGVVSALIDVVAGTALLTQVPVGDRLSTVDLRVDYLRPAGKAELIASAQVIRIGNRVGVAHVSVMGSDPAVQVAEGRAVYQIKRSSNLEPKTGL